MLTDEELEQLNNYFRKLNIKVFRNGKTIHFIFEGFKSIEEAELWGNAQLRLYTEELQTEKVSLH